MDKFRFPLLGALGVVLFLLYQAWQKDYPPVPEYAQASTPGVSPGALTPESRPSEPSTPGDAAPGMDAAPGAEAPAGQGAADTVLVQGDRITVLTDVYEVEIDLAGGDIRRLKLLNYPSSKDQPDVPLALLNDELPNFFIVNSGLISVDGDAPDHQARYEAPRRRFELASGREDLLVPLRWTDEAGRTVTKTWRFSRSSYEIELIYAVTAPEASGWEISPYVRLWRVPFRAPGEPPFIQSFMGVAAYEAQEDGFKFRKYDAEELVEEPLAIEQLGGWVAMLQHYFIAAVLPASGGNNRFYARPSKNYGFLTEYVGARQAIDAGGGAETAVRLYIGPKLQRDLDGVEPGLNLTVDYGLLTAIAEPLFWVLDKLHGLTGNWGWSIVLLTLLIKLAFYKLSEAQYRSMARMKKFAPRIQALKERYADDRERQQKAMMELYQKEGFNPLAGCWPMLVQFPVFIALYWVLLESVELRQAEFGLWLMDLSSPDPFYIMPVLFGISMFAQQKLSGSAMTMDPMQQRIMNIMPIGLTVFFAFFPVGLVVYWFVSNIVGIAQQWLITRKLEREDAVQKK